MGASLLSTCPVSPATCVDLSLKDTDMQHTLLPYTPGSRALGKDHRKQAEPVPHLELEVSVNRAWVHREGYWAGTGPGRKH